MNMKSQGLRPILKNVQFSYLGMGFFWASSMLCHRGSILFNASEDIGMLTTILILTSFTLNIFTMISIAVWIQNRPERLRSLPSWLFMLLPPLGIVCYSLVNLASATLVIPLVVIGAVLSGTGYGFFWGSWAETYGRLRPENNAVLMISNFIVAFGLWLLITGAELYLGVPAFFLMVFLVPISWVCLTRCQRKQPAEQLQHGIKDYQKALGSLWQLILGAGVLSFLFGYVWQLAVFYSGSANAAHGWAMVGNLVLGLLLLAFVVITRRRIDLDIVYRFLGPLIVASCLVIPWFMRQTPEIMNLIMSSGYGVFDIVIWYLIAEAAFDNRVSGFVIGAVVRSLSIAARLLGMLVANLTFNLPQGSTFLLFATCLGSAYLLILWLFAYQRYRKRRGFAIGGKGKDRLSDWSDPTDSEAGQPLIEKADSAVIEDAGAAEGETAETADAFNQMLNANSRAVALHYGLSRRESEVLPYLLQGRSAPKIAEKLFVSENTVRSHIRHILEKTNTHSKSDLIDIVDRLEVK